MNHITVPSIPHAILLIQGMWAQLYPAGYCNNRLLSHLHTMMVDNAALPAHITVAHCQRNSQVAGALSVLSISDMWTRQRVDSH